jgi:hypothetical protein
VAVLPTVLAALDSNGDGVISETEQHAYAEQVVRDLSVTVNGACPKLQLVTANFPSKEEIKEGLGSIHLEFKIDLPPNPSNRHLRWENHHQSPISAYQINCLMPADSALRISSEHRNYSQSRYEIDYSDARGE